MNEKGIYIIIIGVIAIALGYIMLDHTYGECDGASSGIPGSTPLVDKLMCLMSTPLFVTFTSAGTVLISAGGWTIFDGIKKLVTG